jgi:DNA-nicking Smr family endonuclease
MSLVDPLYDVAPDGTLDLHGMRVAEAVRAVRGYVAMWRRRQPGAVLHIITGKGRGSPGRPALRPAIRRLLRAGELDDVRDWARDTDDGGFLIRVR